MRTVQINMALHIQYLYSLGYILHLQSVQQSRRIFDSFLVHSFRRYAGYAGRWDIIVVNSDCRCDPGWSEAAQFSWIKRPETPVHFAELNWTELVAAPVRSLRTRCRLDETLWPIPFILWKMASFTNRKYITYRTLTRRTEPHTVTSNV